MEKKETIKDWMYGAIGIVLGLVVALGSMMLAGIDISQ